MVPNIDGDDNDDDNNDDDVVIVTSASGLRDVHLQSPLAVKAGSTVTLRCTYDLEHDSLYTVKWYKGRSEFFRYTPKELPNTQVFPLNGISVDVHNSNSNQVVLNNAQVPITGKYRCEVSADAPSFQTLMASSTLRVVEPPSSHPSMQVDKLRYSASDRLRANCSVPTSLPPANVTWTVNGVPVMPHTMTNAPFNCTGSGLSKRCEVLSLLDTELQGASFHLGTLRVECSARVWSLYYGAVHRDVVEEKPRLGASVLGNRESAGFAPRFQCPWGLLLAVGFLLCRAHRR
ncbi:uncharacterized protein LOC117650815 [Thrips palmi]|uniref:Uncharacterized protein LOC117650815 n=1 Tax=Thrips palmi TaxID=161013 RepID=A0A6P8ZY16_THRPL|nr:uncharacterized protein LOC117650815 [Thrips palmi]